MRRHVLPRIGAVPVADVTVRQAAAIASAMIETPWAAKFALSCIERVCHWAIDNGHREMANPASGPKRQIDVPPPTYARLLPAGELARELAKLDASGRSAAVKLAVRFTALTTKRLCEVRRATFRTWAQERGENWEAAEISLSHRVGSSVMASYARSDMLDMHRALIAIRSGAWGLIAAFG